MKLTKGGKPITNDKPNPSNGNGNGKKKTDIASFFKHIIDDFWLEFEGESDVHSNAIQDLETELEDRLDDDFPTQDNRN